MSDEAARKLAQDLSKATFQQYARSILKIETRMGELVPFELNEPQKIVYREIKKQEEAKRPVRILILKGRRQGMSTLVQMRIAWRMLKQPGIRSHTIAHNLALTHELYGKFDRARRSMPDLLRPDLEPGGERGRRMVFADTPNPVKGAAPIPGSQYRGDSAADPEQVGRGTGVMIAHYTEVPQWSQADETMQSVLSTVPDEFGTEIFVETTAKGASGWFYDKWMEAQAAIARGEEPEFIPVFVPWFKTSEYRRARRPGEPPLDKREAKFRDKYDLKNEQVYWYRDQISRYGDRVVEEFPSHWEEAFLASGMPFFQQQALEFYRTERRRAPDRKGSFHLYPGTGKGAFLEDPFGPTHVFAAPDPEHRYSVGIDFASGRARDYSAIVVTDIDAKTIVATHQSKLLPDDVLMESVFLGRIYNTAILVPERSGIGVTLVDRLVNEYGYQNVYRDVDAIKVRNTRGNRFGWATSVATRKWLLEETAHFIHTHAIDIPCSRLIDEMHTFVYTDAEGDHAAAADNRHDDILMAFAFSLRGFSSAPTKNPRKITPRHRPKISTRSGY